MWEATTLDMREVARLREVIYEAEIGRDVLARPVHGTVETCRDPDEAMSLCDSTFAEVRGEPVDPGEYPRGTWFYWGADRVGVRLAGESRLVRLERRNECLVN